MVNRRERRVVRVDPDELRLLQEQLGVTEAEARWMIACRLGVAEHPAVTLSTEMRSDEPAKVARPG